MKFIEFIESLKHKYSKYTNEVTENGSFLLNNVPLVAPEAYLHSLFCGLSELDIQELQAMLGYQLPTELREFYKVANGFELFCGAISFYGLRKDRSRTSLAVSQQPFDIELPNIQVAQHHIHKTIYLGSYGDDNSLIGYNTVNGIIFRQLRSDKVILNQWQDLPTFICSEYARLATLIDDNGQEMAGVDSTLPQHIFH